MQTFLPYDDFYRSAMCLDPIRHNNQIQEALAYYRNEFIRAWIDRWYNNNRELTPLRRVKRPPWLRHKLFHDGHREMLLQKKPEYYKKFKWRPCVDGTCGLIS